MAFAPNAAPAQRNHRSSGKPVRVPKGILNEKFPLEPDGSVVKDSDFRRHLFPDGSRRLQRPSIIVTRGYVSDSIHLRVR